MITQVLHYFYVALDYAGAALFVVSLFALRHTVMALIQGGKATFSLFRNLHDRQRVSRSEEFQFYRTAILTTFRRFQGAERTGGADAYGTGRANELKLVEEVKAFRNPDPVDYDTILYGIRSVAWGRLAMGTAFGAFGCRLVALILKPFIGG